MIILVPFQQKTEIANNQKITTLELFKIILRITDKSIQLKILGFLSISQLITILSAIIKNEEDDEFYDLDEFSDQLKQLYLSVIESINNFPCVKFVDSLTSKTNDNNRTDDDDQFSDHSSYYELSITSQEYGFFLEYLMDIPENKIKLKLIDIKTKHFTKIYDVVKFYSNGIKINNEELTVIGFSKQLLNKLKVLTLINYENFESFKQFHFEKLDVYGNEVDMNSIELLIKQAKRLKKVFLRGRLKELIPLNIPDHIEIVYDLLALNKIYISEIEHFGNNKIKSLYLNITENCDFELDWALINMKNLESLYISNNFPEKKIYILNSNDSLKNLRLKKLTLQNCEIPSSVDSSGALILDLQILTLINCKIDISVLNFLNNSYNLSEFYLIDCVINWNNYIQLPQRLKKFSFYNANSNECKDLIIVTYDKYDTHESRDYGLRSMILDLNSQLMEVKVPYNKQISILKLDHDYNSNNELNSFKFPVNITSIEFTVYPNFSASNFDSIDLSSLVNLKKVFINLCAYGETYYNPKNLIKIDGVDYALNYVNMCLINTKNFTHLFDNKSESQESSDDSFSNTTDSSFSSGSSLSEEDNNEDGDYESSGNGNFISNKNEIENPSINMNLNDEGKRSNSGLLQGKLKARKTLSNKLDGSLKSNKGVVTNLDPSKQSRPIMIANESKLSQSSENTKDLLKPFLCGICNKSFARRETYKTHSITHTDLKPHTCGTCGKGFRKSGHFRNHISRCLSVSNVMPCNVSQKNTALDHNPINDKENILLSLHEKERNVQKSGQEKITNDQTILTDADDTLEQSKIKEKTIIHII